MGTLMSFYAPIPRQIFRGYVYNIQSTQPLKCPIDIYNIPNEPWDNYLQYDVVCSTVELIFHYQPLDDISFLNIKSLKFWRFFSVKHEKLSFYVVEKRKYELGCHHAFQTNALKHISKVLKRNNCGTLLNLHIYKYVWVLFRVENLRGMLTISNPRKNSSTQ